MNHRHRQRISCHAGAKTLGASSQRCTSLSSEALLQGEADNDALVHTHRYREDVEITVPFCVEVALEEKEP